MEGQKKKHPGLSEKFRRKTGYVSARHDYYSSYYQKNKARIRAKRRKYFHSSAAVREYYRKANRDWYKEHRQKTPNRTIMLTPKGERLYTIRHAANAIGYSVEYFRDLMKKGIIPQALFRENRGWRLYSEGQLALLKRAMVYFDGLHPERAQALLFAFWRNPEEGMKLPAEKSLMRALKIRKEGEEENGRRSDTG